MLPGPIVPPPPPPPSVLIGSAFVPSPSPSDPHSSSISSSLAIIIVIAITTVTITTCIVILRRGCHRRRLSCSSLSPRRSLSPMASVSSPSSESGMRSAASAAVGGALPRDRAAVMALALKDSGTASAASSVTHSAEGPVKGAELVASSPVSAVMTMCGVDTLVPSAPSLPAVERLVLKLISLPSVRIKPGQRMNCIICKHEFLPTDVLLALPVCSHVFHQLCIVNWLRCNAPSCCPSCYASITIPVPDKTKVAPTFCSDGYDIESQTRVPSPPGEEVAEAVGGSHGWLRSSLDRLSGSWSGCSSNCATAAAVPVSSQRTTRSPSQGSTGRLGNGLDCATTEEMPEAVRGSLGWLKPLSMISGSWSGHSSSSSDEMGLPVTTRHVPDTLASSGHSITDSWSRRWDLEAATPTPERPSFVEYARSFFRSSG